MPDEQAENLGKPLEMFDFQRPSRLRILPLAFSLLTHLAVIAVILALPSAYPVVIAEPEVIKIPEKKVIWYRFKELPRVKAPSDFEQAKQNQGKTLVRRDSAIARGTRPLDTRFLIAPPPLVKEQVKLPSPDLIQVGAANPPPAPQPRKAFTAPPAEAMPKKSQELLSASSMPVVPENTPAMDAPKLPGTRRVLPPTQLPPARARGAAPSPEWIAPPSALPAMAGLEGQPTIVVLNSSPVAMPPPASVPASGSGQISRGEILGTPKARAGSGGLSVPNVFVDGTGKQIVGTAAEVPSPAAAPARKLTYQAARLGGAQNAIAAPLRPTSRTVPALVERMFAGRNVYTIVIPMGSAEGYTSDWVLWFGERGPQGRDGRVRAPLPEIKRGTSEAGAVNGTEPVRARASAILSSSGALSEVNILWCSKPEAAGRAVEDLLSWSFRAATRDGVSVESDILIDFTLR